MAEARKCDLCGKYYNTNDHMTLAVMEDPNQQYSETFTLLLSTSSKDICKTCLKDRLCRAFNLTTREGS